MRNSLKALMCATALLGAMTSNVSYALDFTVDTNQGIQIRDNQSATYDNVTVNSPNGSVKTDYLGNLTVNDTLTNNNIIENNGTITTDTIINNTDATIFGSWTATLTIENGGTNSGTIEQNIVNFTTGNFANNNAITANTLNNGATISGSTGNITISSGGLNSGSITQNAIEVETGGIFNNGDGSVDASIDVGTLTNNGTFTNNTNSSVIADSIINNSSIVNNGSIGSDTDKGSIVNSGSIVNNNSIIASTITNNVDKSLTNNGTIKADTFNNSGSVSGENGKLTISTGGTNTGTIEQNQITIQQDGILTSSGAGSSITVDSVVNNGTIKLEGSTFTLAKGTITGGNMTIDKDSAFIVKNGIFKLDSLSGKGELDQNGVMHTSLVNVMNGERVQSEISKLDITNQTNFDIDIHARGNHYTSNDTFLVENFTGNGVARVDNWSLNGDIFGWDAPIDRHINLDHIFVDKNGNPLQGNIEVTDKTQFTPIGWYQLNQKGSGADLHYTLDMVKFNPQVYRGQVATVAQWMNQLAIDDMLFTHSMVLPSFKDEDGGVAYSGIMANRYASTNPLFAPYQYSRKDGGLWYKMYGTFENLNINLGGLGRVGNNAYGALIGADFGLKELKHGWKFMPTAYIGYNGAHQSYPGVGAFQNGGQAGFLGTWYKNNFIIGGLVYGGVYENSMDVSGHTDNAFNYFAGAATKFAYNWRFHRDWVLQPNLMAAYNFFGQQNWHSDYGQMGMMAGMLHGVNVAPGVNLIWEKETFSIYGTLQYMYNINGAVGGRAGNVGLPQVEMERGYIQYGLGFTKKWGDRFSGYLQAVLRNVGRTGVGFQMGFNILLGK